MDEISSVIGALIIVVTLIVLIGLVMAIPTYLLWNECLVPAVSGVREIGWVQAWGINILCGILFKTEVSKK